VAGWWLTGYPKPSAVLQAHEPMKPENPSGFLGQKYFQDLPNISKDRWGPVQRGGGVHPQGGGPPLGAAESAQAKQLEAARDDARALSPPQHYLPCPRLQSADLIAGVDGLLDAVLPAVSLAEPGASFY
jgi:hypothetical protein